MHMKQARLMYGDMQVLHVISTFQVIGSVSYLFQ